MAVVEQCPDDACLEALALGRMKPEDVERLALHCENCERCVRALQTLRAEDVLVETVRSGATAASSPMPESLQNLIDRLRSLDVFAHAVSDGGHQENADTRGHAFRDAGEGDAVRTSAGEGHDDADADDRNAAAAEHDSSLFSLESQYSPEHYDFLSPPRAPAELGWLGEYRVLRILGAGGMGVVFLAEDPFLKRQVALKVMKPALAASATARKRFLREAQAMAAVQHDHIVHINQIDQTGDIPFLAMPYLQGESLADRLQREGRLPLQEVARIGREIAEGLSAAHACGLIHRDVKPGNIWIEGRRGRVKILDFGLVRAVTDDANLTQPGAIAGTPAYMAPEQAHGGEIDHRSDLFSLGCVLYHMITGETPFQGQTPLQILRSIDHDQPKSVEELCPDLSPMWSAFVMRLLAKNREDRPDSAEEVIQSLRVLEAPQVASARSPATRTELSRVPSRKNSGRRTGLLVLTAMLTVLPLTYLFGGTIIRWITDKGELVIETDAKDFVVTIRENHAIVHDKVKDRRFVLTAGEYEVNVQEAGDGGLHFATRRFTIVRGGKETFHARLEPPAKQTADIPESPSPPTSTPAPAPAPAPSRAQPVPDVPEVSSPLSALNADDIPAAERFDWQPQELAAVFGQHAATHWGEVRSMAVRPDGRMVASGGADAIIHLTDASTQLIGTLTGHQGPVCSLCFVNSDQLLSAGADGTLRLWDTKARREIRRLTGHQGSVLTAAVTPDGAHALSGGDDATIRLWEVSSGKELRKFNKSATAVWKIVIAADGRRVLSGGDDRTMRFWNLETGDDLVTFDIEKPGRHEFRAITLSSDGSRAFSGTTEGSGLFSSMRLWDTATGKEVRRADVNHSVTHNGHGVEITIPGAVASSQSDMVLSGIRAPADGNELLLWDFRTGNVIRRFGRQTTHASAVAFSPDGRRAYSGSHYGRLKVWDAETGKDLTVPGDGHESFVSSVDLAPDGQSLLTGGEDLTVRLWKTSAPQRQLRIYRATDPETAYSSPWYGRFSSAGDRAMFFGGVYTVHFARLWDLAAWNQISELKQPTDVSLAGKLFLPEGRQLLSQFGSGLSIHDEFSGLALLNPHFAVFTGHERNLPGTRRGPPIVQLWDIDQDRILKTITPFPGFMGVAASEHTIAVTHLADGTVRLYDAKLKERLSLGPGVGPAMVFSPDGVVIATANAAGQIVFWSTATGEKLREWKFPGRVHSLGFDSTGRYLVTGNANGTAYLLRLGEPGDSSTTPTSAPTADARTLGLNPSNR